MLEMNKVMLIGNLTRDPGEIKSGATFGIAINESWKNKDTGEYDKKVCFVDVTAWGKTGEFALKWLKKGARIYLEGKLHFSQWQTQTGENRSKMGVIAERIQFALTKAEAAPNPPAEPTFDAYKKQAETPNVEANDLPF